MLPEAHNLRYAGSIPVAATKRYAQEKYARMTALKLGRYEHGKRFDATFRPWERFQLFRHQGPDESTNKVYREIGRKLSSLGLKL